MHSDAAVFILIWHNPTSASKITLLFCELSNFFCAFGFYIEEEVSGWIQKKKTSSKTFGISGSVINNVICILQVV